MLLQVLTVHDGGQRGSIKGEENGPYDRTLRDATGKLFRMGLDAVN